MNQQMPGQNPQFYAQNYGMQNPPYVGYPQNQYQNNILQGPNNIMNPVQAQNHHHHNIPQQNQNQQRYSGDRKAVIPGQNQQGQMVFQNPELMPRQPMPNQLNQPQYDGPKKKISVSQGHPFVPKLNPASGHPQQPKTQMYPPHYNQPQHQLPPQQKQKVPVQPQTQTQNVQPHPQGVKKVKKTATFMTVNTLAGLPYSGYPAAEYSHKPYYNICAYAFNSYNGKVRDYNEDTTKTVVNYPKKLIVDGKIIAPHISYFGVFDGHGGKKCSAFLRDKLDHYLLDSKYFPAYPIQAIKEAFINIENVFMEMAIDKKRKALVDKSGSCALIMLIVNDLLYAVNLGDCRALMSTNSGENLYQITRDHKPNDDIERRRIEKSGAKVYYANKVTIDGKEVELKESDYGEGFKFPYRISPGGIAVSRSIGDYYVKIPAFGGVKGALSAEPCIKTFIINDQTDFLLLGCDGIFDNLENERILHKIWQSKKKGMVYNDIHQLCAKITDAIIKYSMEKNSVDNVSVIFIAFKNFERKMKDPDFEYTFNSKCVMSQSDETDLSVQ